MLKILCNENWNLIRNIQTHLFLTNWRSLSRKMFMEVGENFQNVFYPFKEIHLLNKFTASYQT